MPERLDRAGRSLQTTPGLLRPDSRRTATPLWSHATASHDDARARVQAGQGLDDQGNAAVRPYARANDRARPDGGLDAALDRMGFIRTVRWGGCNSLISAAGRVTSRRTAAHHWPSPFASHGYRPTVQVSLVQTLYVRDLARERKAAGGDV
jgi:hypothetical protein